MTEAEALQIGRTVGAEVLATVGHDRQAWYAEILRRCEADPRVAKAFSLVGALSLQVSQAVKQ